MKQTVDDWANTSTKSSQHCMVPVRQLSPPRRAGDAAARRGRMRATAAENIILVSVIGEVREMREDVC